ncbi:aldehyde dehydrogenase family protein [Methylobacterium sp. WL1]|uniref:aldehyde dehydrogenase family protein n=3 Tax=unclassified Methylobacterium TaxID=2615210 RepID=UPI0011C1FB3A|nr:aldehyde dehydrogenase family protein [Methylobacterium sp. WL1]QEE40372.1 aldehyde dehydrogenase family protein [Methylobacterium sp. WL1]
MSNEPESLTRGRARLPGNARDLLASLAGRHLIGNALVGPVDGTCLTVLDPATGDALGQAPAAGPADVQAAVAAARAAGKAWARVPARERGRLVAEGGRRIAAASPDLAPLLAAETGKAIRTECRPEIATAADILAMFGGLATELKGETLPFSPDMLALTTREPLGVVAAILPWNVPLVLMALKIGPALVAGNTVVVKASEEAPFATIEAARLLAELLPPGVLNVICGTGAGCGAPLVRHPDVAKVTFTGSQAVGEAIYREAADKLIPVSLELGGKSPMLVFADADLDRAVAGAVAGMRFTRQGQSCTASSRIYVDADLHDPFVERLAAAVSNLRMGDPLDEATDIGTVINARQRAKIMDYIAQGEATPGAQAVRCGTLPEAAELAGGLFVEPVLFTGLTEDSPLMRDEIFGPVACIVPFSDEEAVLEAANAGDFGLAATVWTTDLRRALRVSHALDAGYVQVNQNLTIQPNLSYGGFKKSGLGKEASLEAMLEHFTRKKTIVVDMR